MFYTWSTKEGYNVSSIGDKKFSALYARLEDGRTIEDHYQVDIKGYPSAREGKGKPPKMISYRDAYDRYCGLWREYMREHESDVRTLARRAEDNNFCLRDVFAKSPINQAAAIARVLNEQVMKSRGISPKYQYFTEGIDEVGARIFVFGSNMSGVHGKGAAKLAREKYGAETGVSEGLMDACYAIPTCGYYTPKAFVIPALKLNVIESNVKAFLEVAESYNHPEKKNFSGHHYEFFVTRIGCGLGGYLDSKIAPFFKGAPTNCVFDERWMRYIEGV